MQTMFRQMQLCAGALGLALFTTAAHAELLRPRKAKQPHGA